VRHIREKNSMTTGSAERFKLNDYPALAALALNDDDVASITRQGFVSKETRGQRAYHKLRFRRACGRQAVRYLGSDFAFAEAVREELAMLQANVLVLRRLSALSKKSRIAVRSAKRHLGPLFEARGWKFHGSVIRRTRIPRNVAI
jgi:hypothetical protein